MKKCCLSFIALLILASSFSQTTSQNLEKAFKEFESDEQMKNGISSLYVIDAATGKVVFDKNSRLGLAPASTQKIITSVTAFELLGIDYRYKTELWVSGEKKNDTLWSNLFLKGSGDPTLGSWRYEQARPEKIVGSFVEALRKKKVKYITGMFLYNADEFPAQVIPDGWIWEDIGNYYGAGADVLNWKENQYEITLRSGAKVGDPVEIISPSSDGFVNQLRSAAKGTGDNAYVYYPVDGFHPIITGTIPINEDAFRISASNPNHTISFALELAGELKQSGIGFSEAERSSPSRENVLDFLPRNSKGTNLVAQHLSPSLDSIIYWFNRRSINLYGEALVKTFAYEKQGYGSTDSGVALLRRFWEEKGIDENELNLYDGSGLSPLNRVTTHAQVEILKYAKSRTWYNAFYESIPEYNAMKMKSGTITDVKGFCGYHKAKDGREYIYSFLVNNYSGRASAIVAKMYKVLDQLK
jgi:D-alanyl-D-alanine carboxypeptidase/D-alanyl-D-alanine-endopeptidase (penicillin-binding protein 4)